MPGTEWHEGYRRGVSDSLNKYRKYVSVEITGAECLKGAMTVADLATQLSALPDDLPIIVSDDLGYLNYPLGSVLPDTRHIANPGDPFTGYISGGDECVNDNDEYIDCTHEGCPYSAGTPVVTLLPVGKELRK